MTNAAVGERPAVQVESKPEPVEESKAPSTALDGEEQTTQEQAQTEAQAKPAVPEARTQRVSALADAEREEIRQQAREEALAEAQGRTPEQIKEATKARLRQLFPQTIQTVDQVVSAAVDELGQPRALTPAEAKRIKDAFESYNRSAAETAEDAVATTVQQVAYGLLDKEGQEILTKLTTEDSSLPNYLNAWVETAALRTKAVKSLSLEDAMKVSTKLKKEIAARDVEQFDAGYEEGLNAPAGSSPRSRNNERTPPGQLSYEELEDKYARGETTAAETREYERLRDERRRSR